MKSVLPISRNDGESPSHSRLNNGNLEPSASGKWPVYRAHLVATSGEFIGTILFLYFAFGGTQVASMTTKGASSPDGLLYISLSFGMSLAVSAWAFYRISGGLFNPAVRVLLISSCWSSCA